jgi:hypothetical protein
MPLLKREPDHFPEGLFDLSVERHPWWVAPLDIPYYVPQREQKIRRAGRNFVSKGQFRVFVSISMLRTSFTVELDREALAPLAARVERFGRVLRRAA